MPPQTSGTSPSTINGLSAVALNERVFYVHSWDGLHRSTDGGKSWNMVNIPAEKEWDPVDNLIVHQGGGKAENMPSTLYATFGYGYGKWIEKIAKTTDKGNSWKTIQMEIPMTTPNRKNNQAFLRYSNLIVSFMPKMERLVTSKIVSIVYPKTIGLCRSKAYPFLTQSH